MSCCWEGGYGDQPECEREEAWHTQPDGWRGDVHYEDWPEHLAGAEYWLFKRWGDPPTEE